MGYVLLCPRTYYYVTECDPAGATSEIPLDLHSLRALKTFPFFAMYRSSVLALFMCASATAFLAPGQAAVGTRRNVNVFLHDFRAARTSHIHSFLSFRVFQAKKNKSPSQTYQSQSHKSPSQTYDSQWVDSFGKGVRLGTSRKNCSA